MIVKFFQRYSLAVLAVVAFAIPFFLVGTQQALQSNKNDIKSWLPPVYEETTTYQWYRSHFESDMFILASWEGCTLNDQRLELLAQKLTPPLDYQRFSPEPRFFKSIRTGKQILDGLVAQGLERQEAEARLRGFVLGRDGEQTCLVLTIRPEAEAEWEQFDHGGQKFLHAVVEKIYSVAENECAISRDALHLGGPPIDNVSIDQEGERSLLRLAALSAGLGLLMSWWCLRSWSLTAMVFTTSLFSAGLALALVYYSGSQMNAILLTMPALVFVTGTSGAIHLANYYRDTVREQGLAGAPGRAVASAWLPLALAAGTTAIGLVSLMISELVPIQLFGVFSALGVIGSLIITCFYMPALLQLWPPKGMFREEETGLVDVGLSPRWRAFCQLVIRRNGWVTVGALLLLVVGVWGTTRIETSVKLMRLFSPKARILADYAWLEEHLGPLVPMEVVLRIDTETCRLDMLDELKLVQQIQGELGQMDEVGSALAAPTFIRNLPERVSSLERRVWGVRLQRHQAEMAEFFQVDQKEHLWRISARVHALTNLDYGTFVDDLKRVVEPILDTQRDQGVEGVAAVYTGLVPLIYKAQHSMLDNLILGFVGDLILIGIAIVFLMRNWSSGLLLMIPSVFPLAIVFGAMGLLGIVVDTGTVMTPAVALGVTVDDAIHFMLWCRHGQERGMNRQQSIMFAFEDCARAIYQSWGVIGLGLFGFALSSFVPTQRFGYLMLAMLTASAIGNLVVLPALLAGPLGHFFWKEKKSKIQPKPSIPPHHLDSRREPVGLGWEAESADIVR